jgi:hypothetical protein
MEEYTCTKLAGHQDKENAVLYLLRERSTRGDHLSILVLRGCDPGLYVMLSQGLIALLLMTGILAIYMLTISFKE